MRAIEVNQFGGPEVLQQTEIPEPVVAENQVLVKVAAVGVNPVETYIRAGTYPKLPELPFVPGGNVAGVIESCGSAVRSWQVGDRIYSSATVSGAYAEKALCFAHQIFHLPDKLSFSQGAAIGVPAATAYRALFLRGECRAGEKVLIHGASGSVGQAAIQLARGAGLEVFGTAGSEAGMEIIKDLGATAFDHRKANYIDDLEKAALGSGYDLILEMLANKNLEADLGLLGNRGRVVIIGSRGRIEIDPRATMGKESDIRGLAVFNATEEEVIVTHKGLAKAMKDGQLVPRVSLELKLSQADEAHLRVMQDGNCGKIVLIP